MREKEMSILLNLIVLRTPQLFKTVEFYEILGLKFQEEKHGDGPRHYACVMSEIVLEIYPSQSQCEESTRIGFCVPSLEEIQVRLAQRGISAPTIYSRERIGRYMVVKDLDNRALLLTEKEK